MTVDPHIQALREVLVADHEAHIAEVQRRADEAAARGDDRWRDLHQGLADRLRAMAPPFPGEKEDAA
jgi:hypothetical protein